MRKGYFYAFSSYARWSREIQYFYEGSQVRWSSEIPDFCRSSRVPLRVCLHDDALSNVCGVQPASSPIGTSDFERKRIRRSGQRPQARISRTHERLKDLQGICHLRIHRKSAFVPVLRCPVTIFLSYLICFRTIQNAKKM